MSKHHLNLIEGCLYRTPLILEAKSPTDMSWDLGFHHANRGKKAEPNGPTVSDGDAYMAGYNHSRQKVTAAQPDHGQGGDQELRPSNWADSRPEQDIKPSMRLSLHDVPKSVLTLAKALEAAGGRALVVGGAVRDKIIGSSPKDWDVEVYGMDPDKLTEELSKLGRVDAVGKKFGILKIVIGDEDFDVSIPRRENKVGQGHKGFIPVPDPTMTISEAAKRRDVTINTVSMDPFTGDVYDPYNGVDDINNRVLRATDPEAFAEDAVRILRGAQFAARFQLSVDPETMQLMADAAPELALEPPERVGDEWRKLLLKKGVKPSIGMEVLKRSGALKILHPDLASQADSESWERLKQVTDRSIGLTAESEEDFKVMVRFASVFHNTNPRGMAKMLHSSLRIPKNSGQAMRIERLVGALPHANSEMSDADIRHLSKRLSPKNIQDPTNTSIEAFALLVGSVRGEEEGAQLLQRAENLGVSKAPPVELFTGDHLNSFGVKPSRQFGEILRQVYKLQLDGQVVDLDSAKVAARQLAGLPPEDPSQQRESLNLI
jgi:tRNA nucleotidyltransferase (CCA-adding enzyme)